MKYSEFSKLSFKERKQVPFSEKPLINKISAFVILGCLFGFGYMICNTDSKPVITNKTDLKSMAYMQSKDVMERTLKAPSTADFPFFPIEVKKMPNGQLYSVISYVDAENSFGAKIRTNFQVMIQYIGGDAADINNWTVIDIKTSN